MIRPRVAMIQDGARLHYAIPVALQRAGMLGMMFTDFYAKKGSSSSLAATLAGRLKPSLARKALGRRCDELDDRLIRHNPWLFVRMLLARPRGHGTAEYAITTCRWLGRWMQRVGLDGCNAAFGFIRDFDPVFFAEAARSGIVTVGDQMSAPIAEAVRVARHLKARWPEWDPDWSVEDLLRFERLQSDSWAALRHFTCASDYVRSGLIAEGVDPDRISVLPYPIDVRQAAAPDRSKRTGPVVVGCVGRVTLPKGAPYFLEAAKRLKSDHVRFVMVGPMGLPSSAAAKFGDHVELAGPVPRDAVARRLEQFDMFFFPATCEGSSGAVIEAMASGLPVVTSPNSGTFARDGMEGFLRAYDDVDGFVECITRLAEDPSLRRTMGEAARKRVEGFGIDHYAARIGELFTRLVN